MLERLDETWEALQVYRCVRGTFLLMRITAVQWRAMLVTGFLVLQGQAHPIALQQTACVTRLSILIPSLPLLFPVTCTIMHKTGAALLVASGAVWGKRDGKVHVAYDNTDNTLHCIVTVFGLSIAPTPQVTSE